MSKSFLGRATIKYNGKLINSEPGAKINIGGMQRNKVETTHSVGFSEQRMASKLECVIPLGTGLSLDELRNLTDVTVTFACDTGHTYIVAQAWVSELLEVTDGEGGKVPLVFEGEPAEELL